MVVLLAPVLNEDLPHWDAHLTLGQPVGPVNNASGTSDRCRWLPQLVRCLSFGRRPSTRHSSRLPPFTLSSSILHPLASSFQPLYPLSMAVDTIDAAKQRARDAVARVADDLVRISHESYSHPE